ncbi:MAG: metallophosphoesterase [Bacilli bacterium]
MKKNRVRFVSICISVVALTSCGFIDTPSNSETSSGDSISDSISSTSDSTSPSTSEQPSNTVDVSFYAINDFHGAIETSYSGVTLGQTATFLKARKAEGSILINSGDMWQGSMLSNYNNGELVTRAFKNIGFDASILGNHEFDWNTSYIEANEVIYGEKFLGCNIMEYPRGSNGWVKSPLTNSSKIVYANAGTSSEVKIGIIGAIPTNQLSSITSLNTENVIFVDETPIIKAEASRLRDQEGCDLVVASYHAGQDQVDRSLMGGNSGAGIKYLDAVFCAHTHAAETSMVNGIPLVQAGGYGGKLSKVVLTYNLSTKTLVKCKNYSIVDLNGYSLSNDPEVQSLIDAEKEIVDPLSSEVIGKAASDFDSEDQLPKMFATSIYKQVMDNDEYADYQDVDYIVVNYARTSITNYNSNFDVTFSMLYDSIPFDNGLYYVETNGEELMSELLYNYFYRVDGDALVNSTSAKYKIIVYDYLLFHIRVNIDGDYYTKYYNYFPYASLNNPALISGLSCREAARTEFESASVLDPNNYVNDRTNRSKLSSNI